MATLGAKLDGHEKWPDGADIVLIRHGQSRSNVGDDELDCALTSVGEAQAASWANISTKWDVDVILCSPLQRTLQTASLALGKTDPASTPVLACPPARELYWSHGLIQCIGTAPADVEESVLRKLAHGFGDRLRNRGRLTATAGDGQKAAAAAGEATTSVAASGPASGGPAAAQSSSTSTSTTSTSTSTSTTSTTSTSTSTSTSCPFDAAVGKAAVWSKDSWDPLGEIELLGRGGRAGKKELSRREHLTICALPGLLARVVNTPVRAKAGGFRPRVAVVCHWGVIHALVPSVEPNNCEAIFIKCPVDRNGKKRKSSLAAAAVAAAAAAPVAAGGGPAEAKGDSGGDDGDTGGAGGAHTATCASESSAPERPWENIASAYEIELVERRESPWDGANNNRL
eukprot:g1066.t1